jgi:hypothetical protein
VIFVCGDPAATVDLAAGGAWQNCGSARVGFAAFMSNLC